jgi:hypothetical protein
MAENEQQDAAATAATASNVSAVKLPPFWPNSSANWFRSVEAMFVLKRITDPLDKYYLVLTSLRRTSSAMWWKRSPTRPPTPR